VICDWTMKDILSVGERIYGGTLCVGELIYGVTVCILVNGYMKVL